MKRILIFILTLVLAIGLLGIKYKGDLETNNSVVFPDLTTPGNPATGFSKLYFKSDDDLYKLNSSGTESRVLADGDITAGEGFVRKTGAGAYEGIKSNLGATTDPTNNEDSGDGYAVGSLWINVTLDKVFRATDVTVASAVWKDLSAASAGTVIQQVYDQDGNAASTTTQMPCDTTIPTNTEGGEFMTLAITPASTANILVIEMSAIVRNQNNGHLCMALFQDSTTNALAATSVTKAATFDNTQLIIRHRMVAGTASATTFKMRAGFNGSGTTDFNFFSFGGLAASHILITESTP